MDTTIWKICLPLVLLGLCLTDGPLFVQGQCPPQERTEKCTDDTTILTTTKTYTVVNGKCVDKLSTVTTKLSDCTQFESSFICPKGSCDGHLVVTKRIYRNCTSVWVPYEKKPAKCCCPGRNIESTEEFDEHLNAIRIVTTVTTWNNGECLKSVNVQTKVLECHGECRFEHGPCNGVTATRTSYCNVREGTKCVNKVHSTQVYCGMKCDSEPYVEKEDCRGGNENRVVTRYIKVYNPSARSCVPEVLGRTTEKCFCPNPTIKTECLSDLNLERVTTTQYRLHHGICHMNRTVIDKGLRCSKKPTLLNRREETCGIDGYHTVTEVYEVAVGCSCVTRTETFRRVCCCECLNNRETPRQCNGNVATVIRQTAVTGNDGVCVISVNEIKQTLVCDDTVRVVKAGSDDDSDGHWARNLRKVKQEFGDCACNEVEVEAPYKEYYRCSTNVTESSTCENNKNIVERRFYKLENNACNPAVEKVERNINCPAPSTQEVDECATKNERSHIETTFTNENCVCSQTKITKTCKCRCDPPLLTERCIGDFQVEVVERTRKDQACGCINEEKKSRRSAKSCPPRSISLWKVCDRRGLVGYEWSREKRYQMVPHTCQCRETLVPSRKVCYCKPEVQEQKECIQQGTMWKITRKKHVLYRSGSTAGCRWEAGEATFAAVVCPSQSKVERCDAATNTLFIETTTYTKTNCNCIKNVNVQKASCSCDPSEKTVKKDDCDRENCKQIIYYTIQSRNSDMTCSETQLSRQVTCCCPPPVNSEECDTRTNERVSTRISYTLSNDVCLKDTKINRVLVPCSGELDVKHDCDPKNPFQTKGTYYTYKRVPQNCECVWQLVKKEEGYCKCSDDKLVSSCDTTKGILTITTSTQHLDRPKCIDVKKVTQKTIKCPGPQVIQGGCDKKTGVQLVTTITYHIDNNCECFKNVKVTTLECNCERLNSVTHGCKKDINEKWTKTVTYYLQSGKCVARSDMQQRAVTCQSPDWKVARKGQNCIPQTGDEMDMGLRYDVYEREVKANCTCNLESKRVACNCKCNGPERVSECNNGVLTYSYYRYQWDANQCQCLKTVTGKTREVVTCPKPKREEGQCNPTSCFRQVNNYMWQLEGCKCVRKENPSQEKCCCQPPSSNVVCQPFTNLNENVTYQNFLSNGICLERKIITTTPIECEDESYPRLKPLEECDTKTGRRKFALITQQPDGCKCVERTNYIHRPCGCAPPIIERSECDMRTKRMSVTITKFDWSPSTRQCIKNFQVVRNVPCVDCSPLEGSIKSSCIGGRVLVTSRRCLWNAEKRHCHCRTIYQDRTPMCPHDVKTVEEVCDGTRDFAVVKQIRHHLCDCRCKEEVKILSKKACKCPPQRVSKVCMNNNVQVTKTTSYQLSNNECRVNVKVDEKVIKCNQGVQPKAIRSHCDPRTCEVRVTTTKEVLRRCSCVKKTFVKRNKCCCEPKVPIERKLCDAKRGVQQIVKISAYYDHDSETCRHSTLSTEVPIICRGGRSKTVIGKCQATNDHTNVYYQAVRITGMERRGCSCVPSAPKVQQEPCGCRRDTVKNSCVNNVKITERVSYAFDGYTCVPKLHVENVESTKCRQTTLHRTSDCGRDNTRLYGIITQEARNCRCESKATHGREVCRCPSSTTSVCLGSSLRFVKSVPNLVCPESRPCFCQQREVTYTKSVCCEPPKEIEGACYQGRRRNVLRYFIVKNCKCILQQKVQEVPCGPDKCINEAGDETCKALTADRGCIKDYTVRKEKCRKMCDECLDCQGEVYFIRRRGLDMTGAHTKKDRYFLLYLAYPNPSLCKAACANNRRCKSFQLTHNKEDNKHACLLSPLSQEELSHRLANVSSIEKKVVDHFHKQCKFECPPTKYFPSNTCIDTHRPDQAQRYVRKVTEVSYTYDEHEKRCIRHQNEYTTPCNRTCINMRSEETCNMIKRLGQCNMGDNLFLCGESCHVTCDCSSKQDHKQKVCTPGATRGTLYTHTITYRRVNKVCTVNSVTRQESVACEPVPPKPCGYQINVQECIGNIRQVYNVTRVGIRNKVGACVVDGSKSVLIAEYLCEMCCPTTEVYPQECDQVGPNKFERSVVTKFWGRENQCCKEKIVRNTYGCHPDKCAPDVQVRGSCMLGKRPVLMVWNIYVYDEALENFTCVRKVNIRRIESCGK